MTVVAATMNPATETSSRAQEALDLRPPMEKYEKTLELNKTKSTIDSASDSCNLAASDLVTAMGQYRHANLVAASEEALLQGEEAMKVFKNEAMKASEVATKATSKIEELKVANKLLVDENARLQAAE
ncbi:hypothetical protein GUJ93_ZPchr0002g24146 [Zizania palustris]|uniref:Uncharacterized protein n=1 Tax=Zizania palustris TaxID=103762 RepID=A0A8J5SNP2_ZIZPA|nr:hypothetical protein GUJ93_ZPchr0002g24146 [Zizania palustris]